MKKNILILISLLFLVSPVFAQENVTKLSFNEALNYAIENNSGLKALKNSLSASERDIGIAKSNLMPKLRAEENFVSTNNPGQVFGLKINQERFTSGDLAAAPNSFNNPKNITSFGTAITLEQPLYVRKANIAVAMSKKEHTAQGYMYLRKKEELVSYVVQAYLASATSKEYMNTASLCVADRKEHLRIAESRFKNDVGLYSDILRAKTALTEAEQNYATTSRNYNLSRKKLGMLLGRQDLVEITDTMPTIKLQAEDYYNNTSHERNDLKAMEVNIENAKNNIKFANSDIFPTIAAGASYNLYDHRAPFAMEGTNYTAGASLRWDAFNGGKRKYEVLKAKDNEQKAKNYYQALKDQISLDVYDSYSSINEAMKRLELAQAAMKSAEEGRRLVMKRWESSLSPFVDLLDAQTNLENARANLIKAKNDLSAAIINLSYQSGNINNDLGLE